MKKRKLLIADPGDEFPQSLAEYLQSEFHITCSKDGKEALELLAHLHPDVLIIDLMLPGLDGISLLEAAAGSGVLPRVITVNRFYTDYTLEALTKLHIDYPMIKPCDLHAISERIRELARLSRTSPTAPPDPRPALSEKLLQMGFAMKHRGFSYLLEGIIRMSGNPEQSVTKELYPAIAAQFNCSQANVERSIRTAIAAAWEKGNEAYWRPCFTPGPDGSIPRPTNTEFISRLAHMLSSSEL